MVPVIVPVPVARIYVLLIVALVAVVVEPVVAVNTSSLSKNDPLANDIEGVPVRIVPVVVPANNDATVVA